MFRIGAPSKTWPDEDLSRVMRCCFEPRNSSPTPGTDFSDTTCTVGDHDPRMVSFIDAGQCAAFRTSSWAR